MNSKLPVYKYRPPRNDKAKGDLQNDYYNKNQILDFQMQAQSQIVKLEERLVALESRDYMPLLIKTLRVIIRGLDSYDARRFALEQLAELEKLEGGE